MTENNNRSENEGRSCAQVKSDGRRCLAKALKGEDLCYFHSPAKTHERRMSQRRGGEANRSRVLAPDAQDLTLSSYRDLKDLYTKIVNQVLRGKVGTKRARVALTAAAYIQKVLDHADAEERLAALEQRLRPQLSPDGLFDPYAPQEEESEGSQEEIQAEQDRAEPEQLQAARDENNYKRKDE